MKTRKLLTLLLVVTLSLLTACGGNPGEILRDDAETPVEPVTFTGGPVLMSDAPRIDSSWEEAENESVFGSSLKRNQIQSVTFLTDARQAPDESWDVSGARDGSVLAWADGNGGLYDLYIAGENGVTAPEQCLGLFCGYSNLSSVDFRRCFDTSKAVNMERMFFNCSSLTTLDLSGFDTSNVANMTHMFGGCSRLATLNLSGFDTSRVSDMSWMFLECSRLTGLDVSGFRTANVGDMSGMFYDCSALETLDVSGFDTSRVSDMSWMFYRCSSLKTLDVSGFDASGVIDIAHMFTLCPAVTRSDVSGWNLSRAVDAALMFG